MEKVYTTLTDRARTLYESIAFEDPTRQRRVLIALAGPPGSGKSTVAAEVVHRLNQESPQMSYAAVLPMDGFHYTRAALDLMPNSKEAHERRGISWTFDAQGVVNLITALYNTRYDLSHVHLAPSFNHPSKDPVQDAIVINSNVRLLILEGNWLLFDEQPWARISFLADDTWFVDVGLELALQRVAKRHLKSGIETTWEDALARARNNDMPNGELVRSRLVPPAVRVESVDEIFT